jgi:hypothetical protein
MKALVIFLKIMIVILFLFLCLTVLILFGNPRGGPGIFICAASYLAIGILSGSYLMYKRLVFSQKTFIGLSTAYIFLFFVPAVMLIAFLYWALSQC